MMKPVVFCRPDFAKKNSVGAFGARKTGGSTRGFGDTMEAVSRWAVKLRSEVDLFRQNLGRWRPKVALAMHGCARFMIGSVSHFWFAQVTLQDSGYQSTGFIVAMATKARPGALFPWQDLDGSYSYWVLTNLTTHFFFKIWCSYPLANQDAHPRVRASESCVQGQSAECKGSCLDLRADCSSFNPSASNPPCKPTYTDDFFLSYFIFDVRLFVQKKSTVNM